MDNPRPGSSFSGLLRAFIIHAETSRDKYLSLDKDPKEKVLVGGGTGFIGTELCKTLRRKGYNAVIVSRTPGESRITYADLKELGMPLNTKAVVNLAGRNVLDVFHRWTEDFKNMVP
jgi:NAD(P)-dependent dehydrogenase (short-subunit alcohol dehydrogenase family)